MNERITIRLHKETFRLLKEASAKLGLSMAEVVRRWLEKYLIGTQETSSSGGQEKPVDCKIQEEFKSLHPLVVENNLLLRKIARYTNSQIVIETDEQLKHLRNKADPSL